MRARLLALALSWFMFGFAAASCGHAAYANTQLPTGIYPLIIDDDDGGVVDTFLMFYRRIRDSHVPVRLRGLCVSACTLVLILPKEQVCAEPTASLGFHLAAHFDGATRIYDPELTAVMVKRYYPAAVQKWLAERELKPSVIYMDYDTITSLGVFDPCPDSNQELK